jgi:hypothetical protein
MISNFIFKYYNFIYPGKVFPKHLRVVLGLARSGTTWTANTLAKTSTPIRYFEEPLYHFHPKLILDKGIDHTGIANRTNISTENKLLRFAYLLFTKKILSYFPFLKEMFFRRNDKNYTKVLVKEVHALMGGDFLLKSLPEAKFIFIRRDILTILDSLIYAQGYDTIYHTSEISNLIKSTFISTFFPKVEKEINELLHHINLFPSKQERLIASLTVSFKLTQKYYEILANQYNNIKIFDYERILSEPDIYFKKISLWFNIEYSKNQYENFSDYHMEEPHYRINRKREDVLNRKFKSLNEHEIDIINDFLLELDKILENQ